MQDELDDYKTGCGNYCKHTTSSWTHHNQMADSNSDTSFSLIYACLNRTVRLASQEARKPGNIMLMKHIDLYSVYVCACTCVLVRP